MNPEDKARQGIALLLESIIDILVEGINRNETIGTREIFERTRLPKLGDRNDGIQSQLATHLLNHLVEERRIERTAHGSYEPTKEELAKRRDINADLPPIPSWSDVGSERRRRR